MSVAMELRALLLLLLCFPGLQAQVPHAEQRRREGGTLHIQCPYTDKTYQWKVWCRLRDEQMKCSDSVTTNSPYSPYTSQTKNRITVKDDPTAQTVSVTMTALKAEDSGTYLCAVDCSNDYLPLKTISLNVFKEVLQWELDTLRVQCPYSIWGHSMTWCRREGQTECRVMASKDYHSTRSSSKAPHDRTSMTSNNHLNTVTVTMKKLQAKDTGTYWCALSPEHTRVMEVVLSVSKRTQQYTAKESGNVSVQCLYKSTDYRAVSKAWCKEGAGTPCEILVTTSSGPSGSQRTSEAGRVRIQDDTQQGIVTITMEQLQTQDSGVYWCALHETSGLFRMEEVTLKVSKALAPTALSDTEGTSQATPLGDSPAPRSNVNIFVPLSVVLGILLILALLTSVTLCVRLDKLLKRTGNRGAEDTYDNSEGTAQLGSTEGRESSKDDSKGPKHINLDLQSWPSPEDPLYCNVEPSQAHRNPHGENVEYAVIAFNQFPRNDAG